MPEYPSFDTPQWRAIRDQKLLEWVGDQHAVAFMNIFGGVCEVWDDLIDKDKPVDDEAINSAFWSCFVELPFNPFFDRHKAQLVPVLIAGINAWHDSCELEKGGENDRIFAYVLRDWYCEFISVVIWLTRGRGYLREHSLEIRRFFTGHESFEDYAAKLKDQRDVVRKPPIPS